MRPACGSYRMSLQLQPNSATLPWEQQHRFPPIIPTYLLAVVNVLMFSLQAARRRCWQTLRVVRASRRSRSPVSHFAPPCDRGTRAPDFRGRRKLDRDLDEMGGGTSRPRPRIDARNVETAGRGGRATSSSMIQIVDLGMPRCDIGPIRAFWRAESAACIEVGGCCYEMLWSPDLT